MTRLLSLLLGVAALCGALVPRVAVAQPCVSCWTDKCPDMQGYLEPCEEKKAPAKPPKQPEWPRKNKVTCPPGQVVTADTNGKCCWAGQFWENGACWGKPSACPLGKVPGAQACVDAPVAPTVSNDPGTPSTPVAGNSDVRRVGSWNLYRDTNKHLYAWTDGGVAIELHADSNGWWQLADGSSEKTIYYGSDSSPGSVFYGRPWTKGLTSGGAFGSRDALETSGSNGTTRFVVENGKLVAQLTDKGRVEAALDASTIEFVNSGGKRRTVYTRSGAAPAAAAAFGAVGVAYKLGQWTLMQTPQADRTFVWYGPGTPSSVFEVTTNSNGWWRVKDAGTENVVWVAGDASPQPLAYNKPWEGSVPTPLTVSSGSFEVKGTYGTSRFSWDGSKLRATLTTNGTIEVDASSPLITYRSAEGKVSTFSRGVAGAPSVASGPFGAAGVAYKLGQWTLMQTPQADRTFVWYGPGTPSSVFEVTKDSNGWWRVKDAGTENVVWVGGDKSPQSLAYNKPWEGSMPTPVTVSSGSFEVKGSYGTSKFSWDGSKIRATLTTNATIEVDGSSPLITYRSADGKVTTYSQSLAGASAPSPSAPAGSFGAVGVAYKLGSWTLMQTPQADRTFVWYGPGTPSSVFEVTKDSNGWWRVKDAGTENVVWVAGDKSPQPLAYNKPWEGSVPTPLTVSSGSFEVKGTYGTSRFSWDGSKVRATLTTNGTIEVDGSSPRITYRSPDGTVSTFSGSVASVAPTTTVTSDGSGATMRHGGWVIHRPAGTRHLYAWYSGSDVALEVLGDMSGWWRWRTGSKEMNIFTALEPSVASFSTRPWTSGLSASGTFTPFTIPGTSGPTIATKSGSTVSFELSDHGVVSIDEGSPVIQYRGPSGQRRTYAADGSITKDGAVASSGSTSTSSGAVSAGVWTIHKSSDGNIYMWNKANGTALEFVANSNGWWQFRDEKGAERTVYYSDDSAEDDEVFYGRPWTQGVTASKAIGSDTVSTTGQYGPTQVAVSGNKVVANLTDKGFVEATLDGSRVEFVNAGSKRRTIWTGAATPVAAAPAAPAASGSTFSVGSLSGIGGAGQKEVFVWTSGGSNAAYFSADSNGWFKWRSGGREYVVYSDGSYEADSFAQRPWTGAVTASGGGASFSLSGSRGSTVFAPAGGKLRVTLPTGGVVEIDTANGQGSFATSGGKTVTLP